MSSREFVAQHQSIEDSDKKKKPEWADRDFVAEFKQAMETIKKQGPEAIQHTNEIVKKHSQQESNSEVSTDQDSNDQE